MMEMLPSVGVLNNNDDFILMRSVYLLPFIIIINLKRTLRKGLFQWNNFHRLYEICILRILRARYQTHTQKYFNKEITKKKRKKLRYCSFIAI